MSSTNPEVLMNRYLGYRCDRETISARRRELFPMFCGIDLRGVDFVRVDGKGEFDIRPPAECITYVLYFDRLQANQKTAVKDHLRRTLNASGIPVLCPSSTYVSPAKMLIELRQRSLGQEKAVSKDEAPQAMKKELKQNREVTEIVFQIPQGLEHDASEVLDKISGPKTFILDNIRKKSAGPYNNYSWLNSPAP